METIIIQSFVSMAIMGLVFGAGLAIASKYFYLEKDPREEQIIEALPGANCGACGYPGCSGYASGIVKDGLPVNACIPGGPAVAEKIAKIMGTVAEEKIAQIAFVRCQGGKEEAISFANYDGYYDCRAVFAIAEGGKGCIYGCLGFGTCTEVCPFDAIKMNDNRLPVVNEEKCTGCGKCVSACPRSIITLVPRSKIVFIPCVNKQQGAVVKKICSLGCIACGLCAKKCPVNAIEMVNNYPVINEEKCISCGYCATVCPVKLIIDRKAPRKTYIIDEEKCIGCTICKKNCPVEAISGETKQKHVIDAKKCISCGICAEKCPKDAISMQK
ncbi:MAG: RnfABCDGE type electron transport complex subunit B [Candidatus Coatesbacteria bacterium]|nr:RnfABCDGE type electron transport complex subunit B [Candidatus Coatesbacteria bacterium]